MIFNAFHPDFALLERERLGIKPHMNGNKAYATTRPHLPGLGSAESMPTVSRNKKAPDSPPEESYDL
jgi:hypothetical protein